MTFPLDGVRVIDLSTLFAGPLAATFLGDYGAEVLKIEHPAKPDAARGHGPAKDGINLWWKTLGRNKRTATLNLTPARLVGTADIPTAAMGEAGMPITCPSCPCPTARSQ